jgi:ribosome-associated heat shock protein Hsp15
MKPMRMDKWLWAARFFKTRALAAKACDLNRVTSNSHAAKPAREVRVGDSLVIKNEIGEFTVSVLQLSELRGSAAVAQALFSETDASRAARAKAAEERKAMAQMDTGWEGRPSKRDRRVIDRFRGR